MASNRVFVVKKDFEAESCRIEYSLASTSNCKDSASNENPEPLVVDLHIWKTGYIIDDGPLRVYDDPENREFLETVFKRQMPDELKKRAKTRDILIKMHDHSNDYSHERLLDFLVGSTFILKNPLNVSLFYTSQSYDSKKESKKSQKEESDSKKREFCSKIPMKIHSSFEEKRKLLKEKEEKEKPPAIQKPNKMMSSKLLEAGVKRGTSNMMKNEQDDAELETEKQKIMNKGRSLARETQKKSVEIEKEKVKLAAIELARTDTALKMFKQKRRSAAIKLHNEKQKLNVQEKINDLKESIKRR